MERFLSLFFRETNQVKFLQSKDLLGKSHWNDEINIYEKIAIFGSASDMLRLERLLSINTRKKTKFLIISGTAPGSLIFLLPMAGRRVISAALSSFSLYKGRDLRHRLVLYLIRLLNALGLIGLIFREQLLLLFMPQSDTLIDFTKHSLGEKEDVSMAFFEGSRKFVCPVINCRGEVKSYAKIYEPGLGQEYGENEASILAGLNALSTPGFSVPLVLSKDKFAGRLAIFLSAGENLKRLRGITEAHLNWLSILTNLTAKEMSYSNSPFHQILESEINFIKTGGEQESIDLIDEVAMEAFSALKTKKFKFGLTAREFHYFHILKYPHGHFVIDWEQARESFPQIFDAYSLLLSSAPSARGGYSERYLENIDSLFFKPNLLTESVISRRLANLALSREDAYYFFLLFLIDQLYIHLHAGHADSAERIINLFRAMNKSSRFNLNDWLPNNTS